METLFLLGRIVFGGYFLINAVNHFKNGAMLAGYAQSKNVPSPKTAVLVSGALLVIGGLSILLGIAPGIGIAALLLFLIPVTFMMHAYWKITDPAQRTGEQINFMKNLALIGALLMMTMIPTPWPASF